VSVIKLMNPSNRETASHRGFFCQNRSFCSRIKVN